MPRRACTDCGASRGVAQYSNSTYCFSCHKKVFNKSLEGITIERVHINSPVKLIPCPEKALSYLHSMYISDRHIDKYGLQWAENYGRIAIPVNNGYWLRDIQNNAKQKWLFIGKGKPDLFANSKHLNTNSVIIVEDIFSAIRVSDYNNVISLGGTNISGYIYEYIENYENIYVWLDGDRAGQIGAKNFYNRYKLYRNIKNIFTKKDPKNHTPTEMEDVLCIL